MLTQVFRYPVVSVIADGRPFRPALDHADSPAASSVRTSVSLLPRYRWFAISTFCRTTIGREASCSARSISVSTAVAMRMAVDRAISWKLLPMECFRLSVL